MSLRFPKPTKRVKTAPKGAKRTRPRRKRKSTPAELGREADALWSQIVRHRGSCEAEGPHRGVLQAAHGFSRRYRNTRYLPINGFCLCAKHHISFTYNPLAWTDHLLTAWGAKVYEELKRLAQKTTRADVQAALEALRAEAAARGIL